MLLNSGGTKKLFAILLLGAVVFCYGKNAKAQTDQQPTGGVQISPVRFDWDLNSGQMRTGIINLKNYSDRDYETEIEIEDFYVSDDSTEAKFFIPDKNHPLYAYDVINWISIPQAVTLAPGEGRDITFQVNVPAQTPTGGYYGAIFFKSKVQNKNSGDPLEENSQIKVNQRVGALLVMAVKGSEPIQRSAKLSSFIPKSKVFFANPVELIAGINNSGNLHFKGSGVIKISKFGVPMKNIDLDQRVLYPGRTREYTKSLTFAPWDFGYYRADLEFESEDHAIKVSGATDFWIIPWKTTVAVLILLAVIWFIYHFFTSKFEIRKKS